MPDVSLTGAVRAAQDYLETKRQAFPRFYFLSNQELLDILAQSKSAQARPARLRQPPPVSPLGRKANPGRDVHMVVPGQAVQPHVRKCFEGVRVLEFGEGGAEVVALLSGEGERVALAKPVKARGGVEAWLGGVEAATAATLRGLCHAAMHAYTPQVLPADRTLAASRPRLHAGRHCATMTLLSVQETGGLWNPQR
jgi:dynein heavy chain